MVTHSTSVVSHVWYVEENHLDNRTTAEFTKQDNAVLSAHRVLKWFGAISTFLLSAVALDPDTFGIPANLQPWVFLTAIFWIFAFFAGIFDL